MVETRDADSEPKFNGANWEDLNRIVALAKFQFLQDNDYEDDVSKCAYVAQRFTGPALDWVASAHTSNPRIFANFDGFITSVRQAFGVDDNNITALVRKQLDELKWHADTPVFFSQFDRLTLALGISSHETRVAMVEAKLPAHIKLLLAEQALSFSNYETMRERLNMMWALRPTGLNQSLQPKKSRCGSCGKKGHTAKECRSPKN